MSMSPQQSLIIILVISFITFLIRATPFLLFPDRRETPRYVVYLGTVLPFAMIGMLVIYCLKGASLVAFPFGIPELLSVAAVVALHLWKRNSLLSIGAGTFIYMVLIQFIFV